MQSSATRVRWRSVCLPVGLIVFVLAGLTYAFLGTGHERRGPARALLNSWLDDVRPSKRRAAYDYMYEGAVSEYQRYLQGSDAGIVANARAALGRLEAANNGEWSREPFLVAGWLRHLEYDQGLENATLSVNYFDLSRCIVEVVIQFADVEEDTVVEMVVPRATRERTLAFSHGLTFEVRVGPRWKTTTRPEVLQLPDPDVVPVYVSVVNRLGMRSNAVRVVTMDSAGFQGTRPANLFGWPPRTESQSRAGSSAPETRGRQ